MAVNGVAFVDLCSDYLAERDKSAKSLYGQINMAVTQYKRFAVKEGITHYKVKGITRDIVEDFASFLSNEFRGETPSTIFKRFSSMMATFEAKGLIVKNPCQGVRAKKGPAIQKDTLTIEETKRLAKAPFKWNPDVRRAFLLTLTYGIRYCDICRLKYSNIDYDNMILKFEQKKVAGRSKTSVVTLPLRESALELIGKPDDGNKDRLIFERIPTISGCERVLSKWVEAAGIDKHITWHCGRHSCGTNLSELGVDIQQISAILGHSDISMSQRYVRESEKRKEEAVKLLPKLV